MNWGGSTISAAATIWNANVQCLMPSPSCHLLTDLNAVVDVNNRHTSAVGNKIEHSTLALNTTGLPRNQEGVNRNLLRLSVLYTIGTLESRIGGSTFWILPTSAWNFLRRASGPPEGSRSLLVFRALESFGTLSPDPWEDPKGRTSTAGL